MTEKTQKIVPNSAQIPLVILDHIRPMLPRAEAECVLYIARRTFGFHKKKDRISLSQFVHGITDRKSKKIMDRGTGLSRKSVVKGLHELSDLGLVIVNRSKRGNTYEINLDCDVDRIISVLESRSKKWCTRVTSNPSTLVTLGNQTSNPSTPQVGTLVNTQTKENESITNERDAETSSAPSSDKKTEEKKCIENGCNDDVSNFPAAQEKYCRNHTPMSVDDFMEWMAGSPQRHMNIIGEWADTTRSRLVHETRGQWEEFISRNARVARKLRKFTDEQLDKGYTFAKRQQDEMALSHKHFDITLETIYKKLNA